MSQLILVICLVYFYSRDLLFLEVKSQQLFFNTLDYNFLRQLNFNTQSILLLLHFNHSTNHRSLWLVLKST